MFPDVMFYALYRFFSLSPSLSLSSPGCAVLLLGFDVVFDSFLSFPARTGHASRKSLVSSELVRATLL